MVTVNEFLKAGRSGNIDIVQQYISEGGDINIKDCDGWTALIYAVENGHISCVRELIKAGADINAKDIDGKTALIWACQNQRLHCIKVLIAAKADVNTIDNEGMTALMYASKFELGIECVRELIAAGADINIIDDEGCTAVIYAAGVSYIGNGKSYYCYDDKLAWRLRELIAAGADVNIRNNKGDTALLISLRNLCIEYHCGSINIDHCGSTHTVPLCDLIAEGSLELINAGASVNVQDNQGKAPLTYALESKRYKLAQIIVEHGADICDKDNEGCAAIYYCEDTEVKAKLISIANKHIQAAIDSAYKPVIIKGFDPEG